MAAELSEVVSFLDRELRTTEIPDYSGAHNGLQLANSGKVPRIVSAVDASLPVIGEAAPAGAGLLIVHHGMFWHGVQPISGSIYRKIKTAMDADLAIYSSHLPLDIHPVWGNNILLAQRLGLLEPRPFFESKGSLVGVRGVWQEDFEALVDRAKQVVDGSVHVCPAGTDRPRQVGIITGGAGSEVARVAEEGIDTFLTGEGPHWSYTLAEELNINVLYAGHYATETFGVQACAEALAARYGLSWSFIHRPTGL